MLTWTGLSQAGGEHGVGQGSSSRLGWHRDPWEEVAAEEGCFWQQRQWGMPRKERVRVWGESARCRSCRLLQGSSLRVAPVALLDPGPWLTVGPAAAAGARGMCRQCTGQREHERHGWKPRHGSTESVPLPSLNPCLGSCSQGCKNKRHEMRRRPRKK